MHNQILARYLRIIFLLLIRNDWYPDQVCLTKLPRYDAERLANGLARVAPFHNWDKRIPEAYFSKLAFPNGGYWGNRPAEMLLHDVDIPDNGTLAGISIQVNDLERWRTRILHAIDEGYLVDNKTNSKIDITKEFVPGTDGTRSIDLLGDIIESSQWSVNGTLYGDLHNAGHVCAAFIHDPNHGHLVR